jgi:hypothetical protein
MTECVIDHAKDKCGCYLALVEEKALAEYKYAKLCERQQKFLVTIRQAILETTTLARDDALILELTKMGMRGRGKREESRVYINRETDSTIEKYMLDTTVNKSTAGKPLSTTTSSTTTTTTSTITSTTTDTEKTTQNSKIKVEKSCNGTPTSKNTSNDNVLSPEELAAILKHEDEELKKEKEARAQDDFKIGTTTCSSLHSLFRSNARFSVIVPTKAMPDVPG